MFGFLLVIMFLVAWHAFGWTPLMSLLCTRVLGLNKGELTFDDLVVYFKLTFVVVFGAVCGFLGYFQEGKLLFDFMRGLILPTLAAFLLGAFVLLHQYFWPWLKGLETTTNEEGSK